jgi:hypothetical protein
MCVISNSQSGKIAKRRDCFVQKRETRTRLCNVSLFDPLIAAPPCYFHQASKLEAFTIQRLKYRREST